MRVLIATDAWRPQVNGVVRTYERITAELEALRHEAMFITPLGFTSMPCPTYPEIRLSFILPRNVGRTVETFRPDSIHIATEGPIGLATRRWCRLNGRQFTTSYHTRFPEYAAARFPIPLAWAYAYERWFHGPSAGVMVSTQSLAEDLRKNGIAHVVQWSRGVDPDAFRPTGDRLFGSGEPVFLYVGRVSIEKNIEAFLKLDLPGKKVVVGDGPHLTKLRAAYPDTVFTGMKFGDDLARAYSSADVFVFPSRTDTYGIVLLEAMACGLPVAAYPVTGPRDVVTSPEAGCLNDDLRAAAVAAMRLDRGKARDFAMQFSWRRSAEQFADNLVAAQSAGCRVKYLQRRGWQIS